MRGQNDTTTLESSALHPLRRKAMRLDREGGLRALTFTRLDRHPGEGHLRGKCAGRIRSMIVGKLSDQLKLPFYLWPRAMVAGLIAREYGIAASLVTVRRYLRTWGLSPQKPVRRAYERNHAAIALWLKREYPAIAW